MVSVVTMVVNNASYSIWKLSLPYRQVDSTQAPDNSETQKNFWSILSFLALQALWGHCPAGFSQQPFGADSAGSEGTCLNVQGAFSCFFSLGFKFMCHKLLFLEK